MQDEIIDSMEAESAQNAGDVCESKIGRYLFKFSIISRIVSLNGPKCLLYF